MELRSRWYGWQTLCVDIGVDIGAILGAGALPQAVGGYVFLFGYPLGGPIVHWAHGNVGTGFASLGIRAVAPLLGGFVGLALANHVDDDMQVPPAGFLLGALVRYAAAVTIDVAFLAHETVREPASATRKMNFAPSLGLTRGGGGTGGVAGTF